MADSLTVDIFEPLQGQRFAIEVVDQETISLELVEVKKVAVASQPWDDDGEGQPARSPFSLMFRGPNLPALKQRLYAMSNETLGQVGSIFLVPVHENTTGRYYEAVFN